MIISILIFVSALVFGVISILRGSSMRSNASYNDSAAKNAAGKKVITGIASIIIGLILSFIQPFSLERIDAGNKGLKVNLTGADRGVSSYQYKTGWVFYNSWTEQVKEFPLFQQHIEYDAQQVITKGGFAATIKPSFNYSLREDAIGEMFVNLRLDIREVEQGWLKNAIVSSVNDVANRWEVDAIFNKREEFEAAIIVECNKRVSKWFTVSQLRTNIVPPASLQKAIEGKTKAVQEAQAAQQRTLVAQAEALEKIAIAKGDSAKVIIDAQALALAMKLKQREITPLYIEYLKAQAWDGKLPTTVAGGSGTFLNIKN
jgi:regulator of protease activity HflC (stomatin/prohibitin superfamily)